MVGVEAALTLGSVRMSPVWQAAWASQKASKDDQTQMWVKVVEVSEGTAGCPRYGAGAQAYESER